MYFADQIAMQRGGWRDCVAFWLTNVHLPYLGDSFKQRVKLKVHWQSHSLDFYFSIWALLEIQMLWWIISSTPSKVAPTKFLKRWYFCDISADHRIWSRNTSNRWTRNPLHWTPLRYSITPCLIIHVLGTCTSWYMHLFIFTMRKICWPL